MTRRAAVLMFAIACAGLASGQSFVASYVDGEVSQGSASSWKPVSIGDSIGLDASLRLAAGAYIEIKLGSESLSLSQAGIYSARDLLAAGRASRSSVAKALLSKYLSALSAKGLANAASVAGVRGAEQGKGTDDWVSDDSDVYISAAKDYIAAGDYAAAREQLQKVSDSALGRQNEVRFYMAEVDLLSGDEREAHELLANLEPNRDDEWASDYVILRARMLVQSFAPQAAVELLESNELGLAKDPVRAPLFYYLLALAYKDLGESVKMNDCIARLQTIAGDSDLAKASQSLR